MYRFSPLRRKTATDSTLSGMDVKRRPGALSLRSAWPHACLTVIKLRWLIFILTPESKNGLRYARPEINIPYTPILEAQRYTINVVSVFESQNFSLFCSTANRFQVRDHFKISAPVTPKGTPWMLYACPRVPNFAVCHPTTSHYELQAILRELSMEWLQCDLDHYKIKGSPVLVCLALPLAILQIRIC